MLEFGHLQGVFRAPVHIMAENNAFLSSALPPQVITNC